MHKPCVIIPVFDHELAVPNVVKAVRNAGLPCILVDDASSPACAAVLQQLAQDEAISLGFSHALQVDADGQHDLSDIPLFLEQSRQHPDALICGYPQFDESVPKGRLYARYLTHVWVWINTLSLHIRDSMCGFRLYPLAPVLALIDRVQIGRRMDFDSEMLVRLSWRGQPMRWLPPRVHYPQDGLSHFRLFHDNALISKMHAKLFFGMLVRLPMILWRRWRP
ncbi:glycosyl transferase [Pseudomonas syringae]|uniref:glycosyltransferase family 2 protein n=1 Tax=Pseudomonas syringae TaxID=317 RepID=UPI000BB61F9B|nr:glycosyltransferase family 2 protein [Pseudomonas syringae]PBP69827.1 glycosyl transferase [Pseudomonas syringae]